LSKLKQQEAILQKKMEEGIEQLLPMLHEDFDREMEKGVNKIRQQLRKTQEEQFGETSSPSPQ
jgi:hypothetical protein